MPNQADAIDKVYGYILSGKPAEALAAAQALQALASIPESKLDMRDDEDKD